jgi:hypothetical protein
MPLDITFSIAIDTERENITQTDETVFGTGGNPARADVRVFVDAFKMNYENEETDLTVTPDDDDPQTDAAWVYPYSTDGWYKIYYVAIPLYSGATSYSIYDAVADSSTDIVYRSLSNGNIGNALSDTAFWEVITDEAGLANNKGTASESLNINSLVYQRVFSYNSQYTYSNLIREQCACTDCDESTLMQNYAIFSLWLNGAIVADQRTEVLDGELLARRIQSRFIDC